MVDALGCPAEIQTPYLPIYTPLDFTLAFIIFSITLFLPFLWHKGRLKGLIRLHKGIINFSQVLVVAMRVVKALLEHNIGVLTLILSLILPFISLF